MYSLLLTMVMLCVGCTNEFTGSHGVQYCCFVEGIYVSACTLVLYVCVMSMTLHVYMMLAGVQHV